MSLNFVQYRDPQTEQAERPIAPAQTIETLLPKLRRDVLIDCGHTKISQSNDQLILGRNGQPSETEVETLRVGIRLMHALKETSRRPLLHICFSNREMIQLPEQPTSEFIKSLPDSYRNAIESSDIDLREIRFSIQSTHRNRFAKLIKKIKNQVRSQSLSSAQVFSKYQSLFLRDREGDLFSLLIPYLNQQIKYPADSSNDLEFEEFEPQEMDLLNDPLLRLKQSGVIHLHSKTEGVLCPGTYGGLILGSEPTYDHIAIYSRADDPFIGEKVARGSLAALTFKPNDQRSCLLIIQQERSKKSEISFYNQSEFTDASVSLECVQSLLNQRQNLNGYEVFS